MSLGRYTNNIDVNEKRKNTKNIRQDVPNARMNRNLNIDVALPLERVVIKNADSLNSGRCESTTVPQIGADAVTPTEQKRKHRNECKKAYHFLLDQ